MLLPGCDNCGNCGCVCGTLPYTFTVTFSDLVNRTHSEHCVLTFLAPFGCGAAAVGMSPGGCDDGEPGCGDSDRGPLSDVLLLDGGHGYARLGRKVPALTITGSGSGATFTPTLSAVDPALAEQCRSYRIDSIAVSGGTGYTEGESLTITSDGSVVTPSVAILHTGRTAPTVTASVAGITGAALSVTLTSSGSPPTWGVSSVGVTTPGTGDPFDGEGHAAVTFFSGDTIVTVATGTATARYVNPGAEYHATGGSGTGFDATITLTEEVGGGGHPQWSPSAISITNGGSGYAPGDYLEFHAVGELPGNNIYGIATYYVDTVDGSGAVLTVTGPDGDFAEPFVKFDGIASVTVDSAGAYYKEVASGVPSSVTVDEPGEYYSENPELPACVAEVTVNADACGGTGAVVTATVDDDPASPTFGQITDLAVDDGGDGYLCWHWTCSRQAAMNGEPIVLVAVNPKKLVTLNVTSDFGSGACIRVVPVGDGEVCDPAKPVVYDGLPGPIRELEIVSHGSGYARIGEDGLEVATVTVEVVQLPPSDGSGATVSVTIDDDPDSPTFGQITAATLGSGGSGYTLLGGPLDCSYENAACDLGLAGGVSVYLNLRGNGEEPELVIWDTIADPPNRTVLRCDAPLDDCDDFPTVASLLYGAPSASAAIERDGTVETLCGAPEWCYPPADECYSTFCDCAILNDWLDPAGLNAWDAANPGWTTFVPGATGPFTLPPGVACDETTCRDVMYQFEWSALHNATGCFLNWIGYFKLSCNGFDNVNDCGLDCTLTMVFQRTWSIPGNGGCPDPLPAFADFPVAKPDRCP